MKKPRILIVEDEAIVARDIRQQLEALGYDPVANTPQGEEALTLAAALRPDLVLMDIRLEGAIDGIEAAQSIRNTLSIPVVFLTAFTREETLDRAKLTEPFGYIIKPFDQQELRTVIEIALYRHEAEIQRDRFFNLSLDLLCIASEDGHLKRLNPAFSATLGYTPTELMEKLFLDFVHEEDREATIAEVAKLNRGEKEIDLENRYRCKDGSWKWISWKIQPFHKDGLLYCTGRDVTRLKAIATALSESEADLRKLNENLELAVTERSQELRKSESLFRTLAELAMVGIFRTDAAGRCVYLNDQCCNITGVGRDEALEDGWGKAVHPEDRGRVLEEWLQAARSHQPYLGEYRFQRPDGHVTWVISKARPEFGPAGELLGHVGTMIDITERKLAETQLLRQERLEGIGSVAGSVAHDLNNTLTPILMGVDRLREKYPNAGPLIDVIETSAVRGSDMVRQLLTYARGVEGERKLVRPQELLQEIEQLVTHTFPANIHLRTHYSGNLDAVLGDATQLHQVLLNLCVNARDAMPGGGTLTLEADQVEIEAASNGSIPETGVGRYVVWTVRDTGPGIPPEIIERIFDPFFTTKGPDRGTGLGLSTVVGIVKSHGGFVRVRSEPGQGATFAIYLPASNSGSGSSSQPVNPGADFRGNGETILVVDDEATVRNITSEVLAALNFNVITATNGIEALAQVIEHRAGLFAVITDVRMPQMDGFTFVRTLKHVEPEVPVIVISGLLAKHEVKEFKSIGVRAVLDKPFTQKALIAALSGLAEKESK